MPRKYGDTRTSRHNPNVPDIPGPPQEKYTLPGQQSFVRPRASEPNPIPAPVALDIRGKIGQTVFGGIRTITTSDGKRTTQYLIRRRHVVPTDPRTDAQLECRARLAAAIAAWHPLTNQEKARYNSLGNRRHPMLEGINIHVKEFIANHPRTDFQLDAIFLRLRKP